MTAPGDGEPIASDWSRFWRALTVSRYQYQLTRFVILRLLGLVWLLAFLGVALQMRPLFGSHGLTPARDYLELLRANGYGFHRFPTLFWLSTDDTFMQLMAWLGVALSLALLLGWANLPQLLLLWFLYLSFIVVGQDWYGYGWEMQLCETGYLCAFLAAPLDPRPLPARRPALIAIVLLRWLAIRIMLGAGLIKLRGDSCWRDLTCLDYHFETQPLPNPFSPSFHVLPHAALAGGVLYNHLCEVVSPLLAFGPRLARLIAGTLMLSFQTTLIVTGNLSFLNLLTIVPILACFDDRFLRRLMPARLRAWIDRRMRPERAGGGHHAAALVLACLVGVLSLAPAANMLSSHQVMNRSFEPLMLVNSYGAFGSVGRDRHELVIEGTDDDEVGPDTVWQEYELPCKPGNPARRPCLTDVYHRRLDWQIWFAAMYPPACEPWMFNLLHKLLEGDGAVRALFEVDPFPDHPPRWVRVQRFRYRLAPPGAPTWWQRSDEKQFLPPASLGDDDWLAAAWDYYRWRGCR